MGGNPGEEISDYQKFLNEMHSKFSTPEEILESVVEKITGSGLVTKKRLVAGEVNEVYEIETVDKRDLVLRVNREEDQPFETEDHAIKKCLQVGLFVPDIVGIEHVSLEGKDVSFCIQKRLAGEPLDKLIKEGRIRGKELDQILGEAGVVLSRIHSINIEGFGPLGPNGQGRYKDWETWMGRIVDDAEEDKKVFKKSGLNPDLISQALTILNRFNDKLLGINQAVLLHGDYHPKHLMVDKGRLSGVIDFGSAKSGSPFLDFAYWSFFAEDADGLPLKKLLEGYQGEIVSDPDFDLKLHYYKVRLGLVLIHWYDLSNHTLGLNHSLKTFQKDLNFFS